MADRFAADPAEVETYNRYYPIYGSLYKALKGEFRRIAEAVG